MVRDDYFTHPARRERRQKIAEFVRDGGSLIDAANQFGVAVNTVRESCIEFGVKTPKQSKLQLDAKIVEALISGAETSIIAQDTGMSLHYVEKLRRKHIRRPAIDACQAWRSSTYTVLAKLINTDVSMADIAREFSISRQRIGQICDFARDAGIALHPSRE